MKILQSHQILSDFLISKKQSGRPLIVGISGMGGCGKTVLASIVGAALKRSGYSVCIILLDDFHNPRQQRYARGEISPEGYYHDAYNFGALSACALKLLHEAPTFPVRCQTKNFDLARDQEHLQFQEVDGDTIVFVEGTFVFRPELSPFLHVKVFMKAEYGTILSRVMIRDTELLGTAERVREQYEQRYIPAHKLYLAHVHPEGISDVVIDNDNLDSPQVHFHRD